MNQQPQDRRESSNRGQRSERAMDRRVRDYKLGYHLGVGSGLERAYQRAFWGGMAVGALDADFGCVQWTPATATSVSTPRTAE